MLRSASSRPMSAKKSAKQSAKTEKSASPRRRPDWAAVERDYRTGKFTLRELEGKHGADTGLTARRAKKEGWTKDLSARIRMATEEKLAKAAAPDSKSKEAVVVSVAAEANMAIILGHRKVAQRALEALRQAHSSVLEHGASIENIRDAAVLASAVESLSRTAKNCIEIERRAYSLDDAPPAPPDQAAKPSSTMAQAFLEHVMRLAGPITTIEASP